MNHYLMKTGCELEKENIQNRLLVLDRQIERHQRKIDEYEKKEKENEDKN